MINATDYIKGADISFLIAEEECGAIYRAHGMQGDALKILKDHGFNSARIRIWNDPYSEAGDKYGAGTNDLETALELARRAKALGLSVLLDFHYSDFWADPGKQNIPKAWRGYDAKQLSEAVYGYTLEVVKRFKDEGLAPEFIQAGNEVTNGLLWPYGKKPAKIGDGEKTEGSWENIVSFLNAGIRAVREVLPGTQIMIHLDNGGNNEMYRDWFDKYFAHGGMDFDIIGLSYYPFWHGHIDGLYKNMLDMSARFGKKICVAEVSSGFTMEDYRERELSDEVTDIASLKGMAVKPELIQDLDYPMTKQGQSDFMLDIMQKTASVPGGMGFYYWGGDWIPVPGCGWATDAALEYTKEKGPDGNEWANQALFDYDGNALPVLETIRDFEAPS